MKNMHIHVSDITGRTSNDVVALTALAGPNNAYKAGVSFCTAQVMHNDWMRRDSNIRD